MDADSVWRLVGGSNIPVRVVAADSGETLFTNAAFDQFAAEAEGGLSSPVDDAAWRTSVTTDGVVDRESDILRSGETRTSLIRAQRHLLAEGDVIACLFLDVGSELMLEKELQSAIDRLDRTQRLARIGDFTYDSNTRKVFGSPQLSEMLQVHLTGGFDIADLLMKHIAEEDLEEVRAVLNSNPSIYSFTTRFNRPDGEQIWLEVFGSVISDEQGVPVAWDGTMQDVTERMAAQIERQRLNEEILNSQKLESLGLLAGGVAHDFNNLLVAIMGNADLALLDDNLPSATRGRLQDILTASQRAADLTGQLLAYSGKGRLVKQATDVSQLVSEMSELLRVTISRRSRLQLFLNERSPVVDADQTQIRQVVMNIIMNAAESIEHGDGLITITTDAVMLDRPALARLQHRQAMRPGPHVVIEIADNGHGMATDVSQRLFEPFFTTKVTGRGLGMSAVLGIVTGHEGAIEVDSSEGQGTTFRIYLPATAQAVVSDSQDEAANPMAPSHETLMVVDDDPLVASMLERALINLGYSVVVTRDGREACDTFRDVGDTIDLVLVDLTMPGIDGLETVARLREVNPDVKAILMSGYTDYDLDQRFQDEGIAGFLSKPFLVEDLSRVLMSVTEND